tara:strand:- start:1082 stop:1282 length:201 start_codon:yes stop_codon:yes gene_type:complete
MKEYKYIIGYSKANGNQIVNIEYFKAESLQGIQNRAEQVRAKGCIVHKFGRYNPDQQLAGSYNPKA